MSDRILVMWDGRIAGQLPARSSEQDIMLMATGHGGNGKSAKGKE
jgi:ribose transport system ATP-binding protein